MGSRGQSSKKGAKLKSTNDLVELVTGKDSYYFDPEYQKAAKTAQELFKRSDELRKQARELDEQLDNELIVDPALGRALSRALGNYTDKGKAIKEKLDAIREKQNETDDKWEAATDLIKARDRIAREQQVKKFTATKPTPAKQTEYKGFELDTHTSGMQDKLQSGKAYIAEMSPQEYLQRVAMQVFNRSTLETTIRGTIPSNVLKYARMMRKGTKFYMPWLDIPGKGQEGRHRALAALYLGYEKIPVLVVV